MARSIRLVMLIKNMLTLWGRKDHLQCVAKIKKKTLLREIRGRIDG